MTSLYYLATKILGYKDLGEIHKPICDIVQAVNPLLFYLAGLTNWENMDVAKQKVREAYSNIECRPEYARYFKVYDDSLTRLFLMFRGGFKTTLITIAHVIQCMLIYPGIRILIASHKKEDGSEPLLRAVKHHFMVNDKFRELFPEYCPKPNKIGQIEWGTKDAVTLPNRPRNFASPEATIEVAGMTTNVTGRHYDLIKADDLVTKDSVSNESMIQKTRQQNALLKFLFDQPEWGIMDYIGTPYHFNDLYAQIRKTKITKVAIPVTHEDGNPTFPERFSKGGIEKIRLEGGMTSYEYSCNPYESPIWMADGTFKPIGLIKPGDKVIGFTGYEKGKRRRLVESTVLANGSRISKLITVYFDNGDSFRCTPDHNWWTGRTNDNKRREYSEPKLDRRFVKAINVPNKKLTLQETIDWGYLAGMIDGEGACKYGSISIHQSIDHNPEVCQKLVEVLERLGISYTVNEIKEFGIHKKSNQYVLHTDRQLRANIVNYGKPAKSNQIMNVLFERGSSIVRSKPKITMIVDKGEKERVYSMQTSTGNYICHGYASKNCQYLLNPIPEEDQDFRPEWLERLDFTYHVLPENLRIYMFVDPASSRRKKSDYTAIVTIGIDELGKMYLVDIIRDKLNPEGRTNLVLKLMMKHKIKIVNYEAIGFQDTDVFILKRKGQEAQYPVSVNPIKAHTVSKVDRIRGLTPIYERGLIRWPQRYDYRSQYDNKKYNMVEILRDEMLMFPKCEHDDLLDAHSQLLKITTSKAQKAKESPKHNEFDWWRKQAINANQKKKPGHFKGLYKRTPHIPHKTSFK